MKGQIKSLLTVTFLIITISASAQKNKINTINSGIPWFDTNLNVVSAHGAGIVKDLGKYYLFGEFKSDSIIDFTGFSCYSSDDLYNWKFEKIVLPVQKSGKLGPNRIGERPKVMKCPKTGEYIMYMHTDDLKYKDQAVGYATSKTIDGVYIFQGAILFNGEPIKKWDMGTFQDTDGTGYIITHSGNLYKLSEDYKSVTEQIVKDMTGHCESPVIFKKNNTYFWLGSGLTSWERNDNYYFTATSLKGPWEAQGNFAPKDSSTWNSQTTFVLPIVGSKETSYLFMGDRWAFPYQKSAATYVWQPLIVSGTQLTIPNYKENWKINTTTGRWSNVKLKGKNIKNTDEKIIYSDSWIKSPLKDIFSYYNSNKKEASFSLCFKGTQIGLYGIAKPDGGFAHIEIQDSNNKIIHSSLIEMYCKYAESSLKYLSPVFKKGTYKLIVTVAGKHGNWYKKDGTEFGSTGNFVSLDKLIIIK
ncbi:family 43 glycosylhydrolase [Flavobacterium salmonis]|uniref:Glycosyl hydrolase family 43 n=1 Tax=Flavobacterium salmonis TaxID=2654844 RepID=A0A6V6YSA0_9FLAO|nr:family 43 glycosylhydrolase [Flavobacterium salmonis]CAD0002398.1 glycosyl hydrolase family 43 [Flavobacterium salmonis]